MGDLIKNYEPTQVEPKWTERWLDEDCFKVDENSEKPAFCIVIPPPNVTGVLHMGHALFATLQDIFTRQNRMNGFEALWLPGTDHAGIATQVLVARHLKQQGIELEDIGREGFLEHAWKWKEHYHERITDQLKTMGVSVDWSRERFTLDEGLSKAVRKVFVDLFEEGLIYQDDRLVNWDPKGQTVLSDLEVEQEEEDGFLWHIAYPMADDPSRKLIVATTRPETLLGDTAVAVHPDDERYSDLIGRTVLLPLTEREIPVIGDPEAADMTFGSGAVKITPAHDFNDFETGLRNDLPRISVLDRQGRLNENVPEAYQGLDRFEARKQILEALEQRGLLVKTEPYRFAPGRSQRTGVIVEPLSIGKQWFVDAAKLAVPAIAAVRDGRTVFVPRSWEKTYFNWMENIRPWCVSRQLWWGHRIPAWHCDDCGQVAVAMEQVDTCPSCGSRALQQDTDVLDTWFSSALWPFSTLGWPEETDDLKKFYPTTVLETGYDIIFFWVARMMMMGMHFMGEVPFKVIYLHGMVRDLNGKKMSKTNGNVIDPLHLINGVKPEDLTEAEREHYRGLFKIYPEGVNPQGADALRFALAIFSAQGRDVKLDVRRIEGYKAFLNKLWNATRFALGHMEDFSGVPFVPQELDLSPADQWILERLNLAIDGVGRALREYRVSEAAELLYQFSWHEFCDWYVELCKPALYDSESEENSSIRLSAQHTLLYCLEVILSLLHPFCPFVTEEIWEALPEREGRSTLLCNGVWPATDRTASIQDSHNMALAIEIISGVRAVKGNNNISPSTVLPAVLLLCDENRDKEQLTHLASYIKRQARIEILHVVDSNHERPSPCATTVQSGVEIVIPLAGLIDIEGERSRLVKELEQADNDIAFVGRRLNNENFVKRAPAEVVERERQKLKEYEAARAILVDALDTLNRA